MNTPALPTLTALLVGVDDLEIVETQFTDEYLLERMNARRLDMRTLPTGDTLVYNPDGPCSSYPGNSFATTLILDCMLPGTYIAGPAFVFGERDREGNPTSLSKNALIALIVGWEQVTKKHFTHPDY